LAVLRYLQGRRLVQAADSGVKGTAGAKLSAALESLRDVEAVGDVRGIGMLWGVEFVADKRSKKPFPPEMNFAGRVGQAAVKRGLMLYPMQGCVDGIAGDHLLIAPPAVISEEQIGWAVEQLRAAVEETPAHS
jgi:adenosylmethionine-8-amino-7-oxononanoate aminotransferase